MTRIAIIGTGNSVGNHLTAIKDVGDRAELVAVVDLNEPQVRAISEKHHIPHWYTDAQKMLEVEQPDLVHIVTPPATHKKLIIDSLDAGAWVFCEKPLCASLSEFDQVIQAEERTGRYVSTVFQWRFGSAAKHLKRMINENILGKPLVGICHTLWFRNQAYYDYSWRGKWATEFGGPTVTLGIHLTDLFLWLMDDWREVNAMIGTLDRAVEFEDVAMALVTFENGMMGSIVNSVLSPRQQSYLRLDFEHATVEVKALYRYNNENWRFTLPEVNSDSPIADYWRSIDENIPSGHDVQLREILDSMERMERPPVSGNEARRILEFNSSLYKSALTRKPVQWGEITTNDPFYYSMNGASVSTSVSNAKG